MIAIIRWVKRHKAITVIICVIVLIAVYGAMLCVPYMAQGGVSEETESAFNIEDYYGDGESGDRAQILFTNEEALTERLRLIENATEHIVLSTFEIRADNSGKKIMAALYAAAERGVKVDIIVDGIKFFVNASTKPYLTALGSHENVTIKVYDPVDLSKPWTIMACLHDKYLIADDSVYILGGRNTYDYFLGTETDYYNYDWDVLVYNASGSEDSSVYQILEYFESVWNMEESVVKCSDTNLFNRKKVTAAAAELEELYEQMKAEQPEWAEQASYADTTVAVEKVTLLSNPTDVSAKEPVLFYNMTQLMMESGEEVIFHTPYILCSEYMMERLYLLCAENDSVTMMTNSVANNGNPFGAGDYKTHKQEILDTGLSVLEYDGGVSYHGKCFTIGDSLTAVGSFNWDMRSAYIDTELMLVIDSEELNAQMRSYMEQYEADALTVNGDGTYSLSQGQEPSQISASRNMRIVVLTPVIRLFRFLL